MVGMFKTPNLERAIISYFKKKPMVWFQKQAKNSFDASSELRPLSKLSENQKIIVIGPREIKLWPVKDTLFNATSTCRSPSFCFILKVLDPI